MNELSEELLQIIIIMWADLVHYTIELLTIANESLLILFRLQY
jgi:hypothetical protein